MKTIRWLVTLPVIILIGLTFLLSKNQDGRVGTVAVAESPTDAAFIPPTESATITNTQFTLQTIADHGKLLFQGVGGEIDGIVNPDLTVKQGDVVKMILINADGMPHNLFLPDFDAETSYVAKIGDQTEIIFEVQDTQPGSYVYYCEAPGHRQAGQEGKLIVEEESK